jgi:hypothetical protein
MKQSILPNRLNLFMNNVWGALVQEPKPSARSRSGKEQLLARRDRPPRRDFFYYMQLIDDNTKEIVGHLADISSGGFKLDSQNPIPLNREFCFRLNLTSEVSDQPFMLFRARSRWCRVDPVDPFIYNIGYQLVDISPGDLEIFKRMMERYGKVYDKRTVDLRRSNKW